jgi:hypothetical protein
VHNLLWNNINQIQDSLAIGDDEFGDLIQLKTSFTQKKNSRADLPAKTLFILSSEFGLSIDLLLSGGEIDIENLVSNYNSKEFIMRGKYQTKALAMTSSLTSILEMAKSKQIYDYVVRKLQISQIHKYTGSTVSLSLVNDAFVAMDGFLSISELRKIGEDNFSKFRKTIDQEYFSKLGSSKKLYEHFVHYLSFIQDTFTFEIDSLDEKQITFTSRPTPILIENLGENYDNEYTLIMRMFFASCANKLNGNKCAQGKIINSTLQGDKYTRFSFEFNSSK